MPDSVTRSARLWRIGARIAAQAAAASVTTPDPADRIPPATLSPGSRRRAPRGRAVARFGPVPLVMMLLGALLTGFGVQHVTGAEILPANIFSSGVRPPPRKFPVLEASVPVGINIRNLGLRASVHQVGISGDGTIEVPASDRRDEAGWYDRSPTPGQYGPSVIVGHVDNRTGPAVFHDLDTLRSGARIEVDRADGSVAIFEVNTVKRFNKSEIPADQVYGDFSRPGLRLITCGGRWVGGETGYADNVIVFASLVAARNT
jgi:hypothetical protein